MTLTFSFTPEMQRMWPALSDDRSSPEWVKDRAIRVLCAAPEFSRPCRGRGHANSDVRHSGALPGAPKNYPMQFVIHFNPATDGDKFYPLLMTTGETVATSSTSLWQPGCRHSMKNFKLLQRHAEALRSIFC